MMKTYARIEAGRVAELITTDGDIKEMFHPDLVWVEAPSGVEQGDTYAAGAFSRPAPAVIPQAELVREQIVLLELQQTPRRMREAALGTDGGWLASLDAQIQALRKQLA